MDGSCGIFRPSPEIFAPDATTAPDHCPSRMSLIDAAAVLSAKMRKGCARPADRGPPAALPCLVLSPDRPTDDRIEYEYSCVPVHCRLASRDPPLPRASPGASREHLHNSGTTITTTTQAWGQSLSLVGISKPAHAPLGGLDIQATEQGRDHEATPARSSGEYSADHQMFNAKLRRGALHRQYCVARHYRTTLVAITVRGVRRHGAIAGDMARTPTEERSRAAGRGRAPAHY